MPDCQKSPDRTTCAYGRDTAREIERRECASRFWRRVRGSVLNFVKRDCTAEARPADEAAEAKQGQPSKFASRLRPALQNLGNGNQIGGRNFCRATARRNGFPLNF